MSQPERRQFVRAASGLLILKSRTVFGSEANSAIEIGLIGCGGRGNWIAPFFSEHAGARIVAVADVVKDHLDSTREKLKIAPNRGYYGPLAFKELASSSIDAVVIETPPYFHPEHAMAAVDAGRHVFLAKPAAVDVPGCKQILVAGDKAKSKKLSFLVDFQTRAQPVFRECVRRVHRGDIGAPVMAQVFYYAGRPAVDKSRPGMDPGQGRVMNFYMDRTLGGDIIVEQNIHVLDVANWMLDAHPEKAHGTGGRTDWQGTRYNTGDAYDHFVVSYWYPGGVHVSFTSNQLTRSFSDLCVRCFGINGAADTHYGGLIQITGDNPWMGAEKDDTFRSGAINNVKGFIAAVRSGSPINNTETAVKSNLTAILGRMAAYEQRTVTWNEMLSSQERYSADLNLRW